MQKQLRIMPFSESIKKQIKTTCQNEGKTRPQLYHDAIVAYVSRKEEDEKKEEAK